MTPSLDSLQLYTRLLTGMVLLLNIGLLLAIRMALKYARMACALEGGDGAGAHWAGAKRGLAALILTVVCMNGGAVFANHRLVHATHEIAAELPQNADSELVLSMMTPRDALPAPVSASASK